MIEIFFKVQSPMPYACFGQKKVMNLKNRSRSAPAVAHYFSSSSIATKLSNGLYKPTMKLKHQWKLCVLAEVVLIMLLGQILSIYLH